MVNVVPQILRRSHKEPLWIQDYVVDTCDATNSFELHFTINSEDYPIHFEGVENDLIEKNHDNIN